MKQTTHFILRHREHSLTVPAWPLAQICMVCTKNSLRNVHKPYVLPSPPLLSLPLPAPLLSLPQHPPPQAGGGGLANKASPPCHGGPPSGLSPLAVCVYVYRQLVSWWVHVYISVPTNLTFL